MSQSLEPEAPARCVSTPEEASSPFQRPMLSASLTIHNKSGASLEEGVFWKDMGGKATHIQVTVQSAPNVRIEPELLYEDGEVVSEQSILVRLSDALEPAPRDSLIQTDAHGDAMLRFKITEVSKNHRNQRFRIRVKAADTGAEPALTRCIEVRSKLRTPRRVPSSEDSRLHRSSSGQSKHPPPPLPHLSHKKQQQQHRQPKPTLPQLQKAASLAAKVPVSSDSSDDEVQAAAQSMASMAEQTLAQLVKRSAEVLSRLEWQVAGPACSGARVFFCPCCGTCSTSVDRPGQQMGGDTASHAPSCALVQLLTDCRRVGGGAVANETDEWDQVGPATKRKVPSCGFAGDGVASKRQTCCSGSGF